MVEREGFVVLTKAQVKQLLTEVQRVADDAFHEGIKVGREDGQDAFYTGYDQGYADGHADGYMEGVKEFGDDWDDGYAEGYEAGHIEAELRAAEAAAFEEEPRIHNWVEGEYLG